MPYTIGNIKTGELPLMEKKGLRDKRLEITRQKGTERSGETLGEKMGKVEGEEKGEKERCEVY